MTVNESIKKLEQINDNIKKKIICNVNLHYNLINNFVVEEKLKELKKLLNSYSLSYTVKKDDPNSIYYGGWEVRYSGVVSLFDAENICLCIEDKIQLHAGIHYNYNGSFSLTDREDRY